MATYNSYLSNGGRLTLTVITKSQNIANNTSSISWDLVLTDVSDIRMWANGSWSWSVKIGGTTLGSGTRSNYDFRGYDSLTLGSGTSTVNHTAEGTRTDTWYGAFTDIGAGVGWFGSGTASGSYTIKTIPRATTAAWNSSGTKYVGTTERLNLPRASGSFTHDVTYKIGSKSGSLGTGLGTYVNWAIPVNLLTEFPNSASGSGTFTVVTKNGSTTIGTKTAGFTLTARATDVPTISSVLWDDDNTTVKTNIGAFVQGISLIKGAVSASGLHGSSITEKRLRIGSTLIPEGVPVQITGSGTVVATAEAVDSRGKVGSAPANFSVLPYEAPTLGSGGWQVSRANASNVANDLGQYIRIDLHAVAASLKPGSVEKNALRVAVRTKASDGAWQDRNVINPGLSHTGAIQVSGGDQFVVSKSFEVEVSLSDKTGTVPTVLRTTVPTATVALDLNGTNVGIGKYHEKGALDVNGDGYSNNWRAQQDVYANNTTPLCPIGAVFEWYAASTPVGYLRLEGQAVSRTTYAKLFALWGTTFGTGNGSSTFNLPDRRGRTAVGLNSADTEFNTLGKKFGTKTHTLTTAQMPSHDHSPGLSNHYFNTSGTGAGRTYHATGGNRWIISSTTLNDINIRSLTGATGGGGAHNNIQPSIAAHFIVRAL